MSEVSNVVQVSGPSPYEVSIGRDLCLQVSASVDQATRVAVIWADPIGETAAKIAQVLRADGRAVTLIQIPDGEAGKSLQIAGRCWDALGDAGFTRTDVIVTVGGGAVTDLGGWVAASWLRGVKVIHVPSTLLGMVDAAVGGKSAINTAAGKNLVGAFHPPAAVICDLDLLRTLPTADYAAGLAEVIKAGFIADSAILELIERDPPVALDPQSPVAVELVQRAIVVKAQVVGVDLTEQGLREILNYGHTLAHAIERAEHYRWRHGDAVSVGMVFVAEVARLAGRLDEQTAARHRAILSSVGLPTRYDGAPWETLREAMRIDKKSRADRLRLVVLDGLEMPVIFDSPDESLLRSAFDSISGGTQ